MDKTIIEEYARKVDGIGEILSSLATTDTVGDREAHMFGFLADSLYDISDVLKKQIEE